METLWPKKIAIVSKKRFLLMKHLSISTYSSQLMTLLLFSMLIQYIIHFIKTLSLDQMRVGWIKHNSVDKQKFLSEKIFGREFQVALFSQFRWYDICHSCENTKQLKNEIKLTCHICHKSDVNAWNAAYLISYLASCFKRNK